MKKYMKFFILFLIFTLLVFSLGGCSLSQGTNSFAYVVSMGFDVSENNNLKLTVQIAVPTSSSASSSSGGQRRRWFFSIF